MNNPGKRIIRRLLEAGGMAASAPAVSRFPAVETSLTRDELLLQFMERAGAVNAPVRLSTTAHWVGDLKQLCEQQQVAALRLDTHNEFGQAIAASAAGDSAWPDLLAYDQPIEECMDSLFGESDAALVVASGAIAESGNLVLWSSQGMPRLLSLASPNLIVIVFASQLYGTLAELMSDQGWGDSQLPSEVAILTGPSRESFVSDRPLSMTYGPNKLQILLLM